MSQNSIAESLQFVASADVFAKWHELSTNLRQIQQLEMIYRREVARRYFADAKPEGTAHAVTENNIKLKLVNRLNYKFVTGDKFQPLYDQLAATVGAELADMVVVWKPDVGIKAYKALTPESKAIADQMIITTPSAPSLEIEE